MLDVTRTTTVLLEGLFDARDAAIWSEFDRRYRPIVTGFARTLGLDEADAADVAQETLTRFLEEYRAGKYDRRRGRLRSWLIGLAKYRVADIHRARGRRRENRGESAIGIMPDDEGLTVIWESQRRRQVLRDAMTRLRAATRTDDRTIRAFELYVIDGVAAETVAEQLEMSPHDVYLAKRRVAERLREILAQIEAAYVEEP